MHRFLPCLLALLGLAASAPGAAQTASDPDPMPVPSAGRIERLPVLPGGIPPRPVEIWLPAHYPDDAPYAVVYMHDGQMLFDATQTWNRQEWRADEVASALLADRATRPFIIVGIWNGGARRHVEYFPQKVFAALPAEARARQYATRREDGQPVYAGEVDSDAYLRFLVEDLKPYVDRHYAVSPAREDTVVLGSSMGGLISLYALAEYPQVFGGAACLSTHWPGGLPVADSPIPAALFAYLDAALPPAGAHRLYFDHGDATLDAAYPPLQAEADRHIRAKGYGDADFSSRFFPGAEHSESAWAARMDQPLRFLLPPRRP